MKLPVWPKGDRDIIDEDGRWVGFANTTEVRDWIIKVINHYDKFEKALQGLVDDHPAGLLPDKPKSLLQAVEVLKEKP